MVCLNITIDVMLLCSTLRITIALLLLLLLSFVHFFFFFLFFRSKYILRLLHELQSYSGFECLSFFFFFLFVLQFTAPVLTVSYNIHTWISIYKIKFPSDSFRSEFWMYDVPNWFAVHSFILLRYSESFYHFNFAEVSFKWKILGAHE